MRQMAELGSKVESKPGSASLLCPKLCVSARGCGHAPEKWEGGAEHTGQELTSHLLLQAARRAGCCRGGG